MAADERRVNRPRSTLRYFIENALERPTTERDENDWRAFCWSSS